MASPFDYFKAISEKTEIDYDDSEYIPYMMNMIMANNEDLIFYAAEMNERSSASKKMQYDFYMNLIPKKKRYSPWVKKADTNQLELLSSYFNINKSVAASYAEVLTADDITTITNIMQTGGKYDERSKSGSEGKS